jgi:hypothetical protein
MISAPQVWGPTMPSTPRALIDEAIELAGRSGDQLAVAEVLGARLHALWDPNAAQDRLATASEIIELARRTGDDAMERQGLFWRFVALMELAHVDEAEAALKSYEREVELAGDAAGAVMATARHAMLVILRGRFDQASALIKDVHASGHRAGVPDTDLLTETLHGAISMERDPVTEGPRAAEVLLAAARHRPGHYFEATAALVLLGIGREAEARSELDRVLPRVLTGSGPAPTENVPVCVRPWPVRTQPATGDALQQWAFCAMRGSPGAKTYYQQLRAKEHWPPSSITTTGQPAGRHPAWLPENPHPLRRTHRLGPPQNSRSLTFKNLGCLPRSARVDDMHHYAAMGAATYRPLPDLLE